jgi:RND family efflux transporter MFP subunit
MPEGGRTGELAAGAQVTALAELALCENLAQTSGWAARWSAEVAGADAALLWAPDTVHPLFLCIGAHGAGTGKAVRRAVGRSQGIVRALIRDRKPITLDQADIEAAAADPWLEALPPDTKSCLAVPLEAEGVVVGLLALLFREPPQAAAALGRLEGFLKHAVPALARALRSERKTVGMLRAIERLTNLYDLSKAFGSTIDLEELDALVAHKAADLAAAETASLWLLAGDEVRLAATAHNENYEVENPPAAVGGPIVGDLVADRETVVRSEIPDGDPLRSENPTYELRNVMAIPLIEEDAPVGVLVLANKRGRHPEFSPEDAELLTDLARQAVRALRVARQHEAEKKVEELDALLAVSREITATLDLDKVMRTIVNATAALIRYDRCAIAVQDRGRLRLGAVSGVVELDRKKPDIRSSEELLQWVFLSGVDVAVTEEEDGRLVADRPETEEKFRAFFQERGLKSFYGVLLKDEEGKLGVLGFESKDPILFDAETRDLLQILVNQATVAVRNAQLYQQVPLVGFWKPVLEKRRKLLEIPKRRRLAWGLGALLAFVVLFLVPWRFRIAGPARVLPARRAAVTAGVDGIVRAVHRREGDTVRANDVIATLDAERYQAALADARAGYQIADSEMAQHRETGDAAAMFAAQSRRDELAAQIQLAEHELDRVKLVAPVAGVILTPRLEERVGQRLARGAEFCVVGDLGMVTAEIAVPEQDISYVRAGLPVALKLNPYSTRTFHGRVSRVGARIREEDKSRFLIAEVGVDNREGLLKAGMLGKAKIRAGRRSIAALALRRPARWLYNKLWPLLP